jgi:hypothetical protein
MPLIGHRLVREAAWFHRRLLLVCATSIGWCVVADSLTAQTTLVSTGSVWKYFDSGSLPGADWYRPGFDDSAWPSGRAQFGWGDGDEATPIAAGVDPKPITTYFRHTFVATNTSFPTLTMRLLWDDGVRVFMNGAEISRLNLPLVPITPTTLAVTNRDSPFENRLVQRGAYYVTRGTNLIAVELHQSADGRDDASFDLELLTGLPFSWPTVSLLSPLDREIVPFGPVNLRAEAGDVDGHINSVEFRARSLAGGNEFLIGTALEDPYQFTWLPAAAGRFAVWARAIDNLGRSTVSTTAHLQVGDVSGAHLARGPYLQSGSTTSIVVRWRTDWFDGTRVAFGTNLANPDAVLTALEETTEHEVKLSGLRPDTKYYYSVGTSEIVLTNGPDFFFVTAPLSAKPTRLWVIGDAGTAGDYQRFVRDAYRVLVQDTATERHTDLWLMLGDNAYQAGTDIEYQVAVFETYQWLLQRSVLWPTIGNHDAASAIPGGSFPYVDNFTLPVNGEAGGVASGTERYYSFDYGNIHFICLDANTSVRTAGSPMLAWLEQDLIATDKDWIIAFWHQPPYTWGTHTSDFEQDLIEMRENAVPLLESYGVDLVLCGHSHVYERSFLLDGHYGFSSTFQKETMALNAGMGRDSDNSTYRKPAGGLGAGRGTVYVVCGNSGEGGLGEFDLHPAMAINHGGFGSIVLDIDGLRLDARYLTHDSEIRDYFTIEKGAPPDDVRPSLSLKRAGGQATISWPTSLRPFRLEATEQLGREEGWSAVPGTPLRVGRRQAVTVDLVRSNEMFRLKADP